MLFQKTKVPSAILLVLFLPALVFAAGQKSSTETYLEHLHNQGRERVIVLFKDRPDPNVIGIYHAKLIRQLKIINAIVCEIKQSDIEPLKRQANVKDVVADMLIKIPRPPGPESESRAVEALSYEGTVTVRWNNLEAGLNSKAAWDRFGLDGTGVKIAIIDSGINYTLENLDDNYLGGYDFFEDDDDPMPKLDQTEDHGTSVASVAVGEGVNKVVGVAYNASYYAIRTSDNDVDFLLSHLISGIEWASTEPHKADIISMSGGTHGGGIGWPQLKRLMEEACNNAYNNGIILVVASGNDGVSSSWYPAAFDNVISVGNHAEDQTLSTSSNGGVDVVAPGKRIYVLGADNTVWLWSGTSFATPHASALIALQLQYARQRGIEVNNAYLWEVMKHGAKDLGLDPIYQGSGKIWAAETDANDPNIGSIDLIAANWPIDYHFDFCDYAFADANYPAYHIGQTLHQSITLTNITDLLGNTVETIENLNVTIAQVSCTEPNEPNLPGNSVKLLPTITTFEPGDANAITLSLLYPIPADTLPGLKKTKVSFEFKFAGNPRTLKVSYNDPNSFWYADLPGDLDLNNKIDLTDFAAFALNWRQTDCNEPDLCGRADINKNGSVDLSDLYTLTQNWLAQK